MFVKFRIESQVLNALSTNSRGNVHLPSKNETPIFNCTQSFFARYHTLYRMISSVDFVRAIETSS